MVFVGTETCSVVLNGLVRDWCHSQTVKREKFVLKTGLGTFVCAESSLFLFSGHVLWQILRSYMPSPLWARRAEKHSTDLLTHFCTFKVKMEIKTFLTLLMHCAKDAI